MNEELLKSLLRMKMSMTHTVVERLPGPLKEQVKEFETEVFRVLVEVGKEYLEKAQMTEKPEMKESPQTGGVQSIVVE